MSSEPVESFALDRSVRRFGDSGRIVLGGSPLRLFRLTAAGAALLDRVTSGVSVAPASSGSHDVPLTGRAPSTDADSPTIEPLSGVGLDQRERSLIGRLVDAGVLHPSPSPGRLYQLGGLDQLDRTRSFGIEDVTVVIPVRDRIAELTRLLRSIEATEPSSLRIIVVDDGSADPAATKMVVNEFDAVLNVELLRRPVSGGPGAARNSGVAYVETPLVAFVDSDCVVVAGWLECLLPYFAGESTALVAPRVSPAPPLGGGPVSMLASYESAHSPLDMGAEPARVAPLTRVAYVPSAAMVMRVDLFRRLDGFDASLQVGEDVDLVWRTAASGARVRYVPSSVVHHEVRPNLKAWMGQRFRYGTSAAVLDKRHPGFAAPVAISPYSAAVWALAVGGHPLSAAAFAASTVVSLRSKLSDLPISEVLRLGVGGHLGAGNQIGRALLRAWWPAALIASAFSRRARRMVAISAAIAVVDTARDLPDPSAERGGVISSSGKTDARQLHRLHRLVTFGSFVGLGRLDDLAYGAGVWAGCWRQRSFRALLPSFGGHGDVG